MEEIVARVGGYSGGCIVVVTESIEMIFDLEAEYLTVYGGGVEDYHGGGGRFFRCKDESQRR